ncbi:hypothetical protein KKG63_03580 [Patescibacteria group bacterium]|nr:hypothetical protein [Patescibacteria group bacterium]MBU1999478.1 hypothetical protein [Candidatus Omnitrophota bacterium]
MKGKVLARLLDKEGRELDSFEASNIVVNAGEAFLVDHMAEDVTAELFTMKYMAIGTGITDPVDTQVALVAEVGTRVTGVKSHSGSVYQVLATFPINNPTAEVAITELGLFNQSTVLDSVMFNRLKFGIITKGTADQIEFTVQITAD